MSDMQFKDKFIGFVDILGWKELVKAAEEGKGMSITTLLSMAKMLGTREDQQKIEKRGPTTCPESMYIQRDLDFKLTQISDCVIVSSEVSPAGVINLISHCWDSVLQLLTKGIMCRGYITRGTIYHTDTDIIGSGYHEVIEREKNDVTAFKREANERGTPFVEVDSAVCDYVRDKGDPCVKKMFSRFVKADGNVTALFPFQRLKHSFIIGNVFGHSFDREKERRSNRNLCLIIEKMKESIMALVDRSKHDAIRKAEHYISALDAQLEVCKKTDEFLDTLPPSFPRDK